MATLDTLQDAVNSLTTSTTSLVNEVQVKKATLDASVADAESAQTGAQAARDTANLHKIAAEAAATSATNTAAALTGFDLDAIAATKADTAVDVFVYDTSKDSDGGAWRKRTQATSWYNETLNTATRGSRREFPAVAVIVAEEQQVTIYDGDDPSLPMWMVFNAGNYSYIAPTSRVTSSVAMLNGILCIGRKSSVGFLNYTSFVDDTARAYSSNSNEHRDWLKPISDRNTSDGFVRSNSAYAIVNDQVNDVAMTVLPNAPIDPATGLPVPTIAVATDGGVSVIRDDGTVVDSSDTVTIRAVAFDKNYKLLYGSGAQRLKITSSYDADGFNQDGVNYSGLMGNATGFYNIRESLPISGNDIAMESSNTGISFHHPVPTNEASGLFANVTSTYNTGWMNGDIKGAFLSDTDDTDLVGSGELVTNGAFTGATGTTPPTSWEADGVTQFSLSGDELTITRNNGLGIIDQSITTVVGQTYTATLYVVSTSVEDARLEINNPFVVGATTGGENELLSITFVATATNHKLRVQAANSTSAVITVKEPTLRLADADRSVNNNGLAINGTVTRTPVATGADLVAYSGFTSSNYLEQPYNSDLDFGTGDFCIMGWVKTADGNGDIIIRGDAALSGVWFAVGISSTLPRVFVVDTGTDSCSGSNAVNTDTWVHIVGLRRLGVLELFVDGVLANTLSQTSDLDNTSATLQVGSRQGGANPLSGSLALWRISATAPTAEQIAKIYEDEKVLFQEGAQATLYGASDAVTALAHDPELNLLHVGTSAGRSVFQGLRRVSNTTTAVGTAISASNGLVVEE